VCSCAELQKELYRRKKIFGDYVDGKGLQRGLIIKVDGPAGSNSLRLSTNSVKIKLTGSSGDTKPLH
jgi:hypothetical protein